jgi:hypothetical protein
MQKDGMKNTNHCRSRRLAVAPMMETADSVRNYMRQRWAACVIAVHLRSGII